MSAASQISSTLTASTPCVANRSRAAATMRSCTSRTRRSRREGEPEAARDAVLAMQDHPKADLTVIVNCTNRIDDAFATTEGPGSDAIRVALRDRSPTPLDGDVRRRLLLGGARAGEGGRGDRLHARVLGRAPFP